MGGRAADISKLPSLSGAGYAIAHARSFAVHEHFRAAFKACSAGYVWHGLASIALLRAGDRIVFDSNSTLCKPSIDARELVAHGQNWHTQRTGSAVTHPGAAEEKHVYAES
ncbi:MAG: hypothetical protein JWM36_947 [Hyphomicrobiales bacterium]|nr:hypothetical protein [Hyphomicrobiales bacterium]